MSENKPYYSLKEKIAYHNKCANSGIGANGNELKMTERVNHALASARCHRQLNSFMGAVGITEKYGKRGK